MTTEVSTIDISEDGTHTGPVLVRFYKDHVGVLCPLGHVYTSGSTGPTWGGSWLEAKIAAHQHGRPWVVTCRGAVTS